MKKHILTALISFICSFSVVSCGDGHKEENEQGTIPTTKNVIETTTIDINEFINEEYRKGIEENLKDIAKDFKETEKETENKYAYYQLLNQGYKTGQYSFGSDPYSSNDIDVTNVGIGVDGNVYFNVDHRYIYKYSIETNELMPLYIYSPQEGSLIRWAYCNGYVYYITKPFMDNDATLYRIDSDGNNRRTFTFNSTIIDHLMFCDDGKVTLQGGEQDDETHRWKYHAILSSDFNSLEEIPLPQIAVEHGLSQTVSSFSLFSYYNNKIYASVDGKLAFYDINTSSWTNTEFEYGSNTMVDRYGSIAIIPNYVNSNNVDVKALYDMKADKIIAAPYRYFNYYGGEYSINYDDETGKWYRAQYENNGDESLTKKIGLGIDKTTGSKCCLNDTYYLYIDEYGYFLRTYLEGAENETVIKYKENVNVTDGTNSLPSYNSNIYGTVITEKDDLNIRSESNANSDVIGKVPKGDRVKILEVIPASQSWFKIEYNGITGFCASEYIKKD